MIKNSEPLKLKKWSHSILASKLIHLLTKNRTITKMFHKVFNFQTCFTNIFHDLLLIYFVVRGLLLNDVSPSIHSLSLLDGINQNSSYFSTYLDKLVWNVPVSCGAYVSGVREDPWGTYTKQGFLQSASLKLGLSRRRQKHPQFYSLHWTFRRLFFIFVFFFPLQVWEWWML